MGPYFQDYKKTAVSTSGSFSLSQINCPGRGEPAATSSQLTHGEGLKGTSQTAASLADISHTGVLEPQAPDWATRMLDPPSL